MLILLISYYTASLFFVPPVLVGVVFLVVFRIHYCKEIKSPSIKTGSNLYKDICRKSIYYDNCCENIENKEKRWWKFCAYSSFFPLACVLNHLNYIIIAFIHNLYHATSISLIYGVVGIFIYVMLDRLPYLLQFFLKLFVDDTDYEDKAKYLITLFF